MTTNSHKTDKKLKYLYNPFEIIISGKQTEEKDFFINSIIQIFSNDFKVAHIIENNQKDNSVNTNKLIIGESFYNNKNNNNLDMITKKYLAVASDIAFIDNKNNITGTKIVFINEDDNSEYINSFENVLFFTGNINQYEKSNKISEFIDKSDLDKIKEKIISFFSEKISKNSIYGLVLTGGKSQRMKTDKALIKYTDKPQYEVVYKLLEKYCDKVFISSREDQKALYNQNYLQIHDQFFDIGPSGGILSALNQYPDKTFVVVACDLPFIDLITIEYLIKSRNPYKFATAYISSNDNFPEPLCAIYEPKSKIRMLQLLGIGYDCPRKFLINSEVSLLHQKNTNSLFNANTPEDYNMIKDKFMPHNM